MTEKLEAMMKEVLGEDSARTAITFVLTLDIIREFELEALLHKVVRVLFSVLHSVTGVEVLKGKEPVSFYGKQSDISKNFPLTSGYILKVYMGELDKGTEDILRFVQALLSHHLYNILEMEKLKEKAMRDPLTGAFTRAAGEEILKKLVQSTKRGRKICIVFADLDDLKAINDTFGHDKGDQYLRNFARAFEKVSRSEDIIVRWGGDEFVLAFPTATAGNTAKIMDRIASEFEGSFSWGAVELPEEAQNLAEAIRIADSRMYKMKEKKKAAV